MTELYYRRKLERLDAVKRGEWRREDGVILDLFDLKTVPDAYLETIIISSEERERQDNTGIDDRIVEILQQIRKERDFLRNKANKTKKMKTEQLELNGLTEVETAQAAVVASANINKEKPSKPQLFKIGQIVKGREIINVEKSIKGSISGWSYTTRNLKTGKTERMKQSVLAARRKKTSAKVSAPKKTKKNKTKHSKNDVVPAKFQESSIIREQFPRVRTVKGKDGSLRYAVDARNNPNFPDGETEFYGDAKSAFTRADEIANIVNKNILKADNDLADTFNKASSSQPTTAPTETDIKKMPFFTKLKILFSTK